MASKQVIVIGAGVIGLQSALSLLRAGYAVTLVAAALPDSPATLRDPRYTSAWAGAQFRPHAAANTPAAGFEAATYASFARLAASPGAHSVAALPFVNTFAAAPARAPWWAALDASFTELPPGPGVGYAYRMRSFTLDPAAYLRWLLGEARGGGLRTVTASLAPAAASDLVGAAERAAGVAGALAVVNATGLGAGRLVGDGRVRPVRGQTLLVRGELPEMRTHAYDRAADPPGQDDRPGRTPAQYIVAAIPRGGSGTTIIGSTRQPGRWDTDEDEWDSAWLRREGERLCPELAPFDVLRVNVGLRPAREDGVRVEREGAVVHAYGHDGAGFQQAVGTADRVVELVREVNGRARL